MERLIFVPIEQLEERYSVQWYDWFMRSFQSRNIHPIVVGDTNPRKVKTGQFLDVYDTNSYKLEQMRQIIEILEKNPEDDFTIFFMDIWFPSIEVLGYIRDCADRKIKIKGMIHAGTWDTTDFLYLKGCASWGRNFERSFFQLADVVYCASAHHRAYVSNFSHEAARKIQLVPWPCFNPLVEKPVKKLQVVWPHRISEDKNPELYFMVKKLVQDQMPEAEFVRTRDLKLSKDEYYKLLSESKVVLSTAFHENFGISMVEGYHHWCIPVAPNWASYKEIFDKKYLYEFTQTNKEADAQKCAEKVLAALRDELTIETNVTRFTEDITWVDEI